jgi:hypothetical protein
VRVVGLGAICDLDPNGIDNRSQNSFTVSEFAVLDNGERVILHDERGFSGKSSSGDVWAQETVETITRNVLTTVLPDDDDTDDQQPWEWLAEHARDRGFVVTAEDLRQVPYEVVLTERVLRRLSTNTSSSTDDDVI